MGGLQVSLPGFKELAQRIAPGLPQHNSSPAEQFQVPSPLKLASSHNKTMRKPFPVLPCGGSSMWIYTTGKYSPGPWDKALQDGPAKTAMELGGKHQLCRGVPTLFLLPNSGSAFPKSSSHCHTLKPSDGWIQGSDAFPKGNRNVSASSFSSSHPKPSANKGSPNEMVFATSNYQGVRNPTRNYQCF